MLAAISMVSSLLRQGDPATLRAVVADDVCWEHTLDPNVDIVLRLFGLPCVFVGFGEGVCTRNSPLVTDTPPQLN